MKNILSVVGARPNFMKVAPIHRAFVAYQNTISHKIVHTGQHYDALMSDAFFADLDMPAPTHFLGVGSGTHAEQTAKVLLGFDTVLETEQPDFVLVVGDVNSTLACALASVKRGIPTAHIEAGLRSGDRAMPEEINRLATDAICDELFVTEESALQHLLVEGHSANNIHFVGNTMIDSLLYALPLAEKSSILAQYAIPASKYALITLHRPSNVDEPEQLRMLASVIEATSTNLHVVFPVHPRTKQRLEDIGVLGSFSHNVTVLPPVGYVDFVALQKNARVVLTDSGGIQEETTALGVPCITARTTTERPSTTILGTNTLVPPTYLALVEAVNHELNNPTTNKQIPPLWDGKASERIAKILAQKLTSSTN